MRQFARSDEFVKIVSSFQCSIVVSISRINRGGKTNALKADIKGIHETPRVLLMSKFEPPRRGDVYLPGEEPPADGRREPFFAKGGLKTLLWIVAIFALMIWMNATGKGPAIFNWVKSAIASLV